MSAPDRPRWSVHACPFDADCRSVGAPWRVHVNTPWAHVAVALRPRDRFAHRPWRRPRWILVERPPHRR